ncbi:murein L,D-transpeptidase catalytic domain family protein [Persicitalea sp.]|uniref:murein L,D-transpeptidase catalytic domain family protein n=1 Tax=Persicitalea sp. TaxID=3100273 RepID=UPI003593EEA2
MRKIGGVLIAGVVMVGVLAGFKKVEKNVKQEIDTHQKVHVAPLTATEQTEQICANLYDSLQLEAAGLSREAFRYAWYGFQEAKFSKPILAIADFSQSSRNKRLYVIDFSTNRVVLNTYVAHGRNSGQEFASKFSNVNSSYQSSLGFYRALNTYQGKHGLSLRLQGLEKNINDQALARAIVMHGADYVSEDFIRQTGRLGRSLGCPAIPQADHESLIKLLHDGAGLFLYYPDEAYLTHSSILQRAAVAASQTPAADSTPYTTFFTKS